MHVSGHQCVYVCLCVRLTDVTKPSEHPHILVCFALCHINSIMGGYVNPEAL